VTSASFSPDGELVCTLEDSKVGIWSADTGTPLSLFGERASAALFNPDSQSVATLSEGKVALWDVSSGKDILASPTKKSLRVRPQISEPHLIRLETTDR
jgi:WD40 repeat protein